MMDSNFNVIQQLLQERLILLYIPYVLMGLFATNLGEAWRISQTIDVVRI
ncbi:hypothetical protein SAMN05216391_13113 [Lachnospiraceae bacterium KHCPX20]|nr:hypothetical protein SAMN05216391_13113 [Lachnospiraceae bacterium KHCPX20]